MRLQVFCRFTVGQNIHLLANYRAVNFTIYNASEPKDEIINDHFTDSRESYLSLWK